MEFGALIARVCLTLWLALGAGALLAQPASEFDRDPASLASCDWPHDAVYLVFNKLADGENLIGRAGPSLAHDHIEISMTNRTGLSRPDRPDIDDPRFLPAATARLETEDPAAAELCNELDRHRPTDTQLARFAAFIQADAYWISRVDHFGLAILDAAFFAPIEDVMESHDNQTIASSDTAYLSARYFTYMTGSELADYMTSLPVHDWVDRSYYLEINELTGIDTAHATWRYAYTPAAQAETCAAFGFGFSDYHNLGIHVHPMGAIPANSIVTGCSTDPFLDNIATLPQSVDCTAIPPDFLSWFTVPMVLYSATCPAFVAQQCAAMPDHYLCSQSTN